MKEKQKKKKVKIIYVDDGRTVYNMDGVGKQNVIIPDKITQSRRSDKKQNTHLEKNERRAAIKAAFQTYLPGVACAVIGFVIAGVLLYLWLN